jgi:signal peptidase II
VLRLGLLVAAVVLVLDQASKWYVLEVLDVARAPRPRVLPFLDIVLVWNPGISFGMLQSGSSFAAWLLIGFAVVVTGGLLVWMARARSALLRVALGLAVGGAIGNVVDRLRFGKVVDFLFVHLGPFDWWPVFNVADAAIVAGFVGIVLDGLFARRRQAI